MEGVAEFQDLGELKPTIRTIEGLNGGGVEVLKPDDGQSFAEASEAFRDVFDEYYGDNLDRLAEDDERVIIERLVVVSDDVPYIEYSVVDEWEDE